MNAYFRLLLCFAVLLAPDAWALSPATPPTWSATIHFDENTGALTDVQTRKLDEIERFINERCVGLWEAPAWLHIQYSILLASDPRTDYQLAGTRTESVLRYVKRFNVKLPFAGGVTIEIVTAEKNEKRDHSAQVIVQCKTRPAGRK